MRHPPARIPYPQRRKMAAEIRRLAPNLARQVTDEFFRRYPAWLERYGLNGVERGVEDARFHAEFVAGAIEIGNPDAFAEYLQWAAGVLSTRHIDARHLVENVVQVRDALAQHLDREHADVVVDLIDDILNKFDPAAARAESFIEVFDEVYLTAALAGQRTTALNVAREALRAGASVLDVYADLLQPAQYQIGRLWESNRISVAQEHVASTVTQYVVAQLYDELPRPQNIRGRAVVCGVENELHQLGPQMVADALQAEGWDVRFLGSHLPSRDVIRFARDHHADLLAISVTMIYNIPKAAELIEEARSQLGQHVHIVIGGRAFLANPDLCHDLGADGCALDLRAAVQLVNSLTE